jgi:hypothetical protein
MIDILDHIFRRIGIMLLLLGIIYSNTLHVVFGILGSLLAIQTGCFYLAKSV